MQTSEKPLIRRRAPSIREQCNGGASIPGQRLANFGRHPTGSRYNRRVSQPPHHFPLWSSTRQWCRNVQAAPSCCCSAIWKSSSEEPIVLEVIIILNCVVFPWNSIRRTTNDDDDDDEDYFGSEHRMASASSGGRGGDDGRRRRIGARVVKAQNVGNIWSSSAVGWLVG